MNALVSASAFGVLLLSLLMIHNAVMAGESDIVILTDENFIAETVGRNIFIHFHAPWSEDSKELVEDWGKLAADYKDHEFGLVAQVDCTDPFCETICDDYGIGVFPTLYYGDPQAPVEYHGHDLSYEALSRFAKQHIAKPLCSVAHIDVCDAEQKEIIQKIQKMTKPELHKIEDSANERMDAAHNKYEEHLKEINELYEKATHDYNEEIDQIREETHYKWIQQVLAKMDVDGMQAEL